MNLVHIPRKDELLTGNEEYYELHTLQAGFSKYFLLTSFCRGDDCLMAMMMMIIKMAGLYLIFHVWSVYLMSLNLICFYLFARL